MTATAISKRLAPAIVAGLALASAAALAACGSSSSASTSAPSQTRAFAWLHPAPAPHTWHRSVLPSGAARLAYPHHWRSITSDPGTVTAAVRAGNKRIQGYLNATPQQGPETLSNWGTFRLDHNREEGDVDVTPIASATNLRFRGGAHGSCVIDGYTSSSGHRYREIACIVAGKSATTVVVGAAPPSAWQQQAPALERSISAFQT